MSLADKTSLEERLYISGTNPDHTPDAYITNLLNRASKKIEAIVGRELESASFTEYHDGDGSPYLNLRRGPISDNTSPTVCTVTYDSAGAETTDSVAAGDYFVRGTDANWRLPGYLEMNSSTWTKGQRNYQVVYTAGYSTVPDDLEEACLFAAVWMWNKRKDTALSSRDVGGGVLSGFKGEDELDEELRAMLAPYIDSRV